MQFEADALRQALPDDLTERAYAVMHAVTSAWQMKDLVFEALSPAGQLDSLRQVAARKIAWLWDFGNFLTANSRRINICFQLATAAKHFVVNAAAGPEVITTVDFQTDPATAGQQLTALQGIMVRTQNNSISPPPVVALVLVFVWGRLFLDLVLVAA